MGYITEFSDDFNRADGDLGVNWTLPNAGTVQVVGSVAQATTGTAACSPASSPTTEDVFVQFTINGGTQPSSNFGFGIGVRGNGSPYQQDTAYHFDWRAAAFQDVNVSRYTNGTQVLLLDAACNAISNGNIFRAEVQDVDGDALLIAYRNGTLLGTVVDPGSVSISGTGNVTVFMGINPANVISKNIDNYSHGIITAGGAGGNQSIFNNEGLIY